MSNKLIKVVLAND
jgi:hypothetical protein